MATSTWAQETGHGHQGAHLASWTSDPALELSVEGEEDPLSLTLSGALNERTGPNVVGVVGELLAEGRRQLRIDVGGLSGPPVEGLPTLVAIERAVYRAGGATQWVGGPRSRDARRRLAVARHPSVR